MLIKKGSSGKQVEMIQDSLSKLSFPVKITGVFDDSTARIVTKFQERYNLDTDGVVGDNTYTKLVNLIVTHQKLNTINNVIPIIAKKYVGQEEIPGNMGFKNLAFYKLMTSVGFIKTHPWCAYFAELVWKQSYSHVYGEKVGDDVSSLFSPSVIKTWNNFRKNVVFTKSYIPVPGSLIIFQSSKNKYFGHIGISIGINEANPFYINTIEGNTNDKGGREGYIVADKIRTLDYRERNGLNLVGFINPGIIQ